MTMTVSEDPTTNTTQVEAESHEFVPSEFECFAAAVQFLTRISMPGMPARSAEQYAITLRHGVVYFPLVGGCLGLITASIFLGLSWGLSVWIAALLALGCEALLTGAFHEDAFADTFDALGGGWTREQVLEIMKDSRLGTYGTLALVIGVGVRAASFVALSQVDWVWAVASIVAAATLGRVAIMALMATTNPIRDRKSQARDVSGTQTWRTVGVSLLNTIPLWIVWIWSGTIQAAVTILVVVLILIGFRRYILRRIGGTTGDLLGCSAFITQLTILIGSCWDSP